MSWSGYSEKGTGSQERGPGGFSVDVPGVVQKPDGIDFQPVRAGGNMQSNSAITVGGARPEADETFGELYKLLQPAAQKKAQEVKDQKFMEGMSRAASGVAMQEIVAEQSAFSKLFGTAPAIEGARAYTVAARKSEWVATQANQMTELAKVDPGALPGVIQGSIASQMTGDPETDTALQRELLSATPDLIRQHTKARYLHLQAEAADARYRHMDAAQQEYASMWKMDPLLKTQDQMDRAEQALLQSWAVPEGVDENAHMDALAKSLAADAARGNVHAVRLAHDMGVTARLGPEREATIRQAVQRAAPKVLSAAIPQLANRLIALTTKPPGSMAELQAEWNAINDEAAGITGLPREYGQLISEEQLLSMGATATRAALATRAAGSAESKAIDKVTSEGMFMEVARQALADPSIHGKYVVSSIKDVHANWNLTEERAGELLGAEFNRMQDPIQQARLLSTFAGTKAPSAQAAVDALWVEAHREGVTFEEAGAGFEKMMTLYSSMSEKAQEAYFTSGQREKLLAWERQARSGMALDQVFSTRGAMGRISKPVDPGQDKEGAKAVVVDYVEKEMTERWFGMVGQKQPGDVVNATLGPEELIAAQSIVMSHMAGQPGNAPSEARAKWALAAAQRTGDLSVMGGRLVLNERPDEALKYPLAAYTNYSSGLSNIAMEDLVTEKLAAMGALDETRLVIRAPGKVPRYIITARDKDGKPLVAEVTGDEVKARLIAPPAKDEYKTRQYLKGRAPQAQ